jgi:hypothetical protein
MSRFDYIKYDAEAIKEQGEAKELFEKLSHFVETHFKNGRAKALVLTKLEEAYMWVGKTIRDEQIQRNGDAELQEGRNNS